MFLPLAVLMATAAVAQAPALPWRPTVRLETEVRYDNNPFLLDTLHKQRLAAPSSGDSVSGRFRDMSRATDVIPVPALQAGLEGAGLGRRALAVTATVAYEANLQNTSRRHAELEFRVDQSLRRGGGLRFTADWRPSYFHKNYLADATDVDADSNISSSERRYAAGTSHEVDLALRYRRRVLKTLTADVQVGYLARRYDAPFSGRSRNGPDAGGRLSLQLGSAWTLDADYAVASLGADPTPAVLILDEAQFGVDFNGNLSTTDPEARAVVMVDYSRVERQLGFTLQGSIGAATVGVEYGRRARTFGSTQPYDEVDRGRRDVLNEVSATADVRLAAGVRLELAVHRGAQTTNRAGDPASVGEVADYTRFVASAGLRYRF